MRTIALDRILALNVLTKSFFTLPEDFDARKYFANAIYLFPPLAVVRVPIVLIFVC
ncbi:MAG: hypothetical protein IJQ05_02125 [Bacteroidaceae bacterium]|nr:hypothetical protein [Bacteroidaceae bacterium]